VIRASRRRSVDIWPGFVDALAAVLMVVIFVLLLFTMSQFVLTEALSGRDRALAQLNTQISELAELLSLEQATSGRLNKLVSELRASLSSSESKRRELSFDLDESRKTVAAQDETLRRQIAELQTLSQDIALLREARDQLQAEVAELAGALDESRQETRVQAELSADQAAQLEVLNRQILALREQLGVITEALALAETRMREQDIEIEDLGNRLNLAMAEQVLRLMAFRSEFFGRLKQALGDNPDLRIEGDRFVFQSELLFATASADLGDEGRAQVRRLANTLSEVSARIPDDLDWVLRIDGHTDRRPITTAQFPSNWELSTARALAIVQYLVELGIDPRRLAATGFSDNHPLDDRDTELAYARNRRIEIKLTSR
jgi:chemotaxis protein MotB